MTCQEQTPKLLDQVRDVMRLHHYSIHTERTYSEWIRRYVHFHHMRSRADLAGGEGKIELFLTDLAVNGKVAPSTQNQAMNALVFLYRQVLKVPLEEKIDAVRAERKVNAPVVLTREEVARVVSLLDGEAQVIVLYVCAGAEVSGGGEGMGSIRVSRVRRGVPPRRTPGSIAPPPTEGSAEERGQRRDAVGGTRDARAPRRN